MIVTLILAMGCSKIQDSEDEGRSSADLDGDGDGDNNTNANGDTGATEIEFEECVGVSEGAQNTREPADILFVIDNSKSLYDEIAMVRANMNAFSSRIMESGVDPHIVIVSCLPGECSTTGSRSSSGSTSYGICIDPPLGAADGCKYINDNPDTDNPNEPVTPDSNLPVYKHISVRVPSMKGLQWLINTYEDNNSLTTQGWHHMIRENSIKHVVVVSDDGDQNTAESFDAAFTALSPKLANYQFHGIFAYSAKDLAAPESPCATYAAPASPNETPPILWDTYSDLVTMTHGVSSDLCAQNFDPIFDALGNTVIVSSKINCEWTIPTPPNDMVLNPALVNVEFKKTADEPYIVGNIPSKEFCDEVSNGWYYDTPANPSKILVCPNTCEWFQTNPGAQLNIEFGCATDVIFAE